MNATELSDRVIAVFKEDPVVELFGSFDADGGVDREVSAHIEIAHEFVEKQTAQTLVSARITSEQSAFDDLGQVHQSKDRLVQVGEIAAEDRLFVFVEFFDCVLRHCGSA